MYVISKLDTLKTSTRVSYHFVLYMTHPICLIDRLRLVSYATNTNVFAINLVSWCHNVCDSFVHSVCWIFCIRYLTILLVDILLVKSFFRSFLLRNIASIIHLYVHLLVREVVLYRLCKLMCELVEDSNFPVSLRILTKYHKMIWLAGRRSDYSCIITYFSYVLVCID